MKFILKCVKNTSIFWQRKDLTAMRRVKEIPARKASPFWRRSTRRRKPKVFNDDFVKERSSLLTF